MLYSQIYIKIYKKIPLNFLATFYRLFLHSCCVYIFVYRQFKMSHILNFIKSFKNQDANLAYDVFMQELLIINFNFFVLELI